MALKDISKFQVQMLLNQLAAEGYSYNVVYHVRDIIKAALAEAVDQEVLERNVARKTVIPEIEERDKPVLPVEWYAKLLAGLHIVTRPRHLSDRLVLRAAPQRNLWSDLGVLPGLEYFKVMNTAWRGPFQARRSSARIALAAPTTAWLLFPRRCACGRLSSGADECAQHGGEHAHVSRNRGREGATAAR